MITKNKIKQIRSMAQKKCRQKAQLFLVEGDKKDIGVMPEYLLGPVSVVDVSIYDSDLA